MLAGMDVARHNVFHGDHHTDRESFRIIRQILRELGEEIGILQDLGGAKGSVWS
jgi:pyruvate kinase